MSLKSILRGVLPVASTVLGTVHPLAGAALQGLGSVFGIDTTQMDQAQAEKRLEQAIATASPEQLARLKEIEAGFKVRMAELGLDEEALKVDLRRMEIDAETQDRINARALAGRTGIWPQMVIFVVMCLFAAALTYFVVGILESESPNTAVLALLSTIIGAVLRELASAGSFFTGTTHGSSRKTDMLKGGGG